MRYLLLQESALKELLNVLLSIEINLIRDTVVIIIETLEKKQYIV